MKVLVAICLLTRLAAVFGGLPSEDDRLQMEDFDLADGDTQFMDLLLRGERDQYFNDETLDSFGVQEGFNKGVVDYRRKEPEENTLFNGAEDSVLSRREKVQDREDIYGYETWKNCGDSGDLLQIEHLTIDPEPPVRGKNLTVSFDGTLSKALEGSEKVNVQVKYGILPIFDQEYNLCEELEQAPDMPQCPIQPGFWSFNHTEMLPEDIPAGAYTLTVRGYSKKHKVNIFCLTGTFQFESTLFSGWF